MYRRLNLFDGIEAERRSIFCYFLWPAWEVLCNKLAASDVELKLVRAEMK